MGQSRNRAKGSEQESPPWGLSLFPSEDLNSRPGYNRHLSGPGQLLIVLVRASISSPVQWAWRCLPCMTRGLKQDRGQHFANPPVLCRRAGVKCAASLIFPRLACTQRAALSFTKHRPSTFSCEPHGTHLGQIPTHVSYCFSPPDSTEVSSQRGRGAELRAAELAWLRPGTLSTQAWGSDVSLSLSPTHTHTHRHTGPSPP